MLIALSKYIKPLADVDVQRPAHLAYLKDFFVAGKLLMSGRQNPPQGGVIISHTMSLAEFKDFLANDPFTKAGVAHYEIVDFTPTALAESLAALEI